MLNLKWPVLITLLVLQTACGGGSSSPAETAGAGESIEQRIITGADASDDGVLWACSYVNVQRLADFRFWSDGNGLNSTDAGGDSAFTWTADEATMAITADIGSGISGGLNTIVFESDTLFTAFDTFEDEAISCERRSSVTPPVNPDSNDLSAIITSTAADPNMKWSCNVTGGISPTQTQLFFDDFTGLSGDPDDEFAFPLITAWTDSGDGSISVQIPDIGITQVFSNFMFASDGSSFQASVDEGFGGGAAEYDCTKAASGVSSGGDPSQLSFEDRLTTSGSETARDQSWSCFSTLLNETLTLFLWSDGTALNSSPSGGEFFFDWAPVESRSAVSHVSSLNSNNVFDVMRSIEFQSDTEMTGIDFVLGFVSCSKGRG